MSLYMLHILVTAIFAHLILLLLFSPVLRAFPNEAAKPCMSDTASDITLAKGHGLLHASSTYC